MTNGHPVGRRFVTAALCSLVIGCCQTASADNYGRVAVTIHYLPPAVNQVHPRGEHDETTIYLNGGAILPNAVKAGSASRSDTPAHPRGEHASCVVFVRLTDEAGVGGQITLVVSPGGSVLSPPLRTGVWRISGVGERNGWLTTPAASQGSNERKDYPIANSARQDEIVRVLPDTTVDVGLDIRQGQHGMEVMAIHDSSGASDYRDVAYRDGDFLRKYPIDPDRSQGLAAFLPDRSGKAAR